MSPFTKIIYDIIYYGFEKFGRYYSDYPAFVHDNKDPENLHRVRLLIPGIADKPMDSWSYPKALFAGTTWGQHCIPPQGSMVWVSFRLGDPNHPLWFHGHFGMGDIINWTDKQKRVNNFWFQTPQGNLIELDDQEGTIRITDAYGNTTQTSKSGVSVVPYKDGKIFQGSLDAGDEAGSMGETTQKVADTHHQSILGLSSSLQSLAQQTADSWAKMAAALNPLAAAAVVLTEAPNIVDNANKIIDNTKTVNKSLTDINDDLPKMTSTKIFLDR